MPDYAGAVLFFYRNDLLDKEELHAPRTWQELVQAGKRLTKGGRYGIGIAGIQVMADYSAGDRIRSTPDLLS